MWYKNGKHYREDGPASIDYNIFGEIDTEYWYINGKLQNIKDLKFERFSNHPLVKAALNNQQQFMNLLQRPEMQYLI